MELLVLKKLLYWLICNTSIDNESQTSNKEIKQAFFNSNPEITKDTGMYSYLIGTLLNILYSPDLIRINPNTRNVLYNVKVHSNPVREIIIKNLE